MLGRVGTWGGGEQAELVLPCPGALQFCFGLRHDFVGVGVLAGIFAGFVPELLAALELLLSCAGIDLLGLLCAFREDGHSIGQHFYKSASDAISLIACFAAVQRSEERRGGEER